MTKVGAYRDIFIEAVELLLDVKGAEMTEEKREDCLEYLKKLKDFNYKFGKLTGGSGYADFFRA